MQENTAVARMLESGVISTPALDLNPPKIEERISPGSLRDSRAPFRDRKMAFKMGRMIATDSSIRGKWRKCNRA